MSNLLYVKLKTGFTLKSIQKPIMLKKHKNDELLFSGTIMVQVCRSHSWRKVIRVVSSMDFPTFVHLTKPTDLLWCPGKRADKGRATDVAYLAFSKAFSVICTAHLYPSQNVTVWMGTLQQGWKPPAQGVNQSHSTWQLLTSSIPWASTLRPKPQNICQCPGGEHRAQIIYPFLFFQDI